MSTDTQDLLQRAFADGHLQLITSGKTEKVRYVAVNVSEKWSDPEEKVRAAYYAELICRYGYKPECIGVEVTVPDRTPVEGGCQNWLTASATRLMHGKGMWARQGHPGLTS